MTDPTKERYAEAIELSEFRTWPHVQRIKDRMALEILIDELKEKGMSKKDIINVQTKINSGNARTSRRRSTRF